MLAGYSGGGERSNDLKGSFHVFSYNLYWQENCQSMGEVPLIDQ